MNQYSDEYLLGFHLGVPENDVLYREITGTGLSAALKRCFYDLFMLSYSNNQTKKYIVTTRAMARERVRQYHKYPGVIHPFSKFRCFWEYVMLGSCLLKLMIFSYNTSIILDKMNLFNWCLGMCCEFVIIVDLFISAKSGYVAVDSKNIILDQQLILINFFSTRVFYHALGAIPLHGIVFLRNGIGKPHCTWCNTSVFVTTIRCLSFLSIIRYYDAMTVLKRDSSTYGLTIFKRFLRICLLSFTVTYNLSTIHYSIYMLEIIHSNEVKDTLITDYLVAWYGMPASSRVGMLLVCIFSFPKWIFLDFVNSPHMLKSSTLDKVISILSFLCAQIFCVWGVLLTIEVVSYMIFTQDDLLIHESRAKSMLAPRQVPDAIMEKVKRYYRYPEATTSIIEKVNGLYEALPISLKCQIALHSNNRIISRIPYFVALPTDVMNEIILVLKEEIYMSGDVISNKWNRDDGMIVLDRGILGLYSESGEELEHLIDGDYLDVPSLFGDSELDGKTVVAISNSKILFLDKQRFLKVMKNYPQQFFKIRNELRKANKRRHLSKKFSQIFRNV